MFLDWVQTIFLLCFWCYPAFSYIFIFMSIPELLDLMNLSLSKLLLLEEIFFLFLGLCLIYAHLYSWGWIQKSGCPGKYFARQTSYWETYIRLIKRFIKELESLRPLSGNGNFSITKGTLTSMVSVGITYIIIMVQFKYYVQTPNQHQLNLTSS